MRILSGTSKRRALNFCPSPLVRPTKERVRQALLNVLVHRFAVDFAQATILEGFGGTGVFSFEVVSRGARNVWCIEKDPKTAHLIQENAQRLGMDRAIHVVVMDFFSFQPSQLFDLVFLDPPYDEGLVFPALLHLLQSLSQKAVVIVECRKKDVAILEKNIQNLPGLFIQVEKIYGKIALLFLRKGS